MDLPDPGDWGVMLCHESTVSCYAHDGMPCHMISCCLFVASGVLDLTSMTGAAVLQNRCCLEIRRSHQIHSRPCCFEGSGSKAPNHTHPSIQSLVRQMLFYNTYQMLCCCTAMASHACDRSCCFGLAPIIQMIRCSRCCAMTQPSASGGDSDPNRRHSLWEFCECLITIRSHSMI